MTAHSFIEFVFNQFLAQSWQNGISIFRSGGITHFQAFGELLSCKIRAGIGENHEVRLKIHSHGKFVQWMECTCQANRRRAEKCSHIAAFCIYLDQEQAAYLQRLNLSAGDSEAYLKTTIPILPISSHEEKKNDIFNSEEKWNIIKTAKKTLEQNNFETIFSSPVTELISIDLDKEEPWLNVCVKIENTKKLNYRFGVDDTCRLLFQIKYIEKSSEKVRNLIRNDFVAKRYFEIKNLASGKVSIQKNVALQKNNKIIKKIALCDIPQVQIGKLGLFVKKIGYIKFQDNMNTLQASRWHEYPNVGIVEGDTAAHLIENNFLRLKETADVLISKSLSKFKIYDKISIPEMSVNKNTDGSILIDAKFVSKSADEESNLQFGTLIKIIRARLEGKQYLETEKGFVKISQDIDWLKHKVQEDGQLKLSQLEFVKFHEQFAKNTHIKGKSSVINKIRMGLISRDKLEMPPLEKDTQLNLRPYQQDGLKWLWWLYTNQLGGLLADEMGLGKTHQAMGLISGITKIEKSSITLVVCPTSVIDHWLDKMTKYIPNITNICYHGALRKGYLGKILKNKTNHYVFVTSYGILIRDIQIIMNYKWNLVILDEAHLVKNQSTRTYKAACKIHSNMRLCLTGTPLENDLMELKNLFDYIAPNYLGSDADFKRKYVTNDKSNDPITDIELHRFIHPFKMRRNKIDVLKDLPDKIEDIRFCHLNTLQKKLYHEALNLKGQKLIDDLQNAKHPIPYIHIFSLISLLKQICNDPGIIDPQYLHIGSGKLQVFDELISEALESNQKVVVFSQYAKMVNRISQRLVEQGIKHVTLTGQSIHRGNIVKEFQENKNIKVFVGSLLAGGTGIDLTSASVVIHFDRWWNAAKENQATDRVHRIGQTRNIQVYKLITRGTLEERIDEIINRKKMIFERFIEQDEEMFKNLSREDLLQLLKTPANNTEIDDNTIESDNI
jgi:SNF2 family DNA or RNA helicase